MRCGFLCFPFFEINIAGYSFGSQCELVASLLRVPCPTGLCLKVDIGMLNIHYALSFIPTIPKTCFLYTGRKGLIPKQMKM
jgi:hypothetical protein